MKIHYTKIMEACKAIWHNCNELSAVVMPTYPAGLNMIINKEYQ